MKFIDINTLNWDKSIPTIGEPFEKCDDLFVKIDNSKPILFPYPKDTYYFIGNSAIKFNLYAIVPQTKYHYIGFWERRLDDLYVKIEYEKPEKEIEITMKEVEEKFGCKVKIKNG